MLISVLLAVLIGVPTGVWSGYSPRLTPLLDPVPDLNQTLPPYIYRLPEIALRWSFWPVWSVSAVLEPKSHGA